MTGDGFADRGVLIAVKRYTGKRRKAGLKVRPGNGKALPLQPASEHRLCGACP